MTHHKRNFKDSIHAVILGILLLAVLTGCGDDEPEIEEPPAPNGLKHILTKGKVSLSWDKTQYAEYYRVYRDTKLDGKFTELGTTDKPAYDDTKVTAGATYFYKVAGVNSDGIEGRRSAPYEVQYGEGKLQEPQELIDQGINLGETLIHHDLKLKNVGDLELHWTVETKDNWISLTPTEGAMKPQEEQVVRITVKRQGEPKKYQGTVLVKGDTGQTFKITVQMSIAPVPRIAIEPDPPEIIFQGVQEPQTLTIRNTGSGILEWEIQNIPDWLALDDTQSQTSNTSQSRIQLTIKDAGQLQPDKTYTATLIVESNDTSNPEQMVNVTLNVPAQPPKLYIEEADKHLTFKPGESNRRIDIHNVGGGVMKWHVQSTEAWLKVAPKQDETEPGDTDTLTFTVDRENGIPGKTLKATVTIDAGDAGVQPVVIEVSIPEESWTVSPESMTLDGITPQNILIHNKGEGQLKWSASSESWIVHTKSGKVEPGKTYSLQVSANLTSLTLGEHEGEVLLESLAKGGKEESVRIRTVKKGRIAGAVLNSRTRGNVRNVQISLDGQIAKTFPSGDFEIECMEAGEFHLKAEKKGYVFAIFEGILDDWGNTEPVEMWLRPIPRATRAIQDLAKPFRAPVDICLSSDGTRAYVSDELRSVSVIDVLADEVIAQIQDVGKRPMGIAANPREKDEIYIADSEDHKVLILNAQSRKVINRVDVDKYPQQFAISQDGSRLYVTCRDSRSVVLIDTERRQVEDRFTVGREPYGVALSPDERVLYVANAGDSRVSVLNALTGQRIVADVPVANTPQHLAVSEDYVYVSSLFGDRVSVIHQASQKLAKHIEMGNLISLGDIAVLEEPRGGDVIYVIDQTNSALRLIDSVTLEVIDEVIRVGDMPMALAIRPDGTKIYVVNGASANISVLEF